MSVRRLNKLKFIVGCATAALFVSLLFPIGIAAKNSLDSPGDQGTILIIASYNPDTRRMSSFVSYPTSNIRSPTKTFRSKF